ncbi:MAG: sigma-54 dependent transcriptional regulator [Polyangiales bacterium]
MARILVADDEEGLRSFLAEALELDDHEVRTAADGLAARALAEAEAFDLVLTDLKMPGLDGMALLTHLRATQPEVEVVMLTAHGDVRAAVEAMRAGAFDFLTKPLQSPGELRLVVRRALERRSLRTRLEATHRERREEPPLALEDPIMTPVVDALAKVARTSASVLLLGESGTGKEVAARRVHTTSERRGAFVAINCAALSPALLESELFGHEKGAFTGAHAARRGRLELAEGGTLFLDEIGELAPELQAKLLRVLQERTFERVGGVRTLRADVRWIAATHRDLAACMRDGSFREDLYHRLAVFPVRLPALRERPRDVIPLANLLLGELARELGRPVPKLSDPAAAALRARTWPGNVRELRNAMERAVVLLDGGDEVREEHLWLDEATRRDDGLHGTLADLERRAIEAALARHDGNRRRAAEELGIGERTLYDKLKRFG